MITICTATLVLASTGRPLRRAGLKRQSRTARTTGSVSAGKPLITSTDATRPSAATLTRTTTVPPWNTNGEIFASTVVSGTGSSKPDSCTGDDAAVAPTTKSEANRTARRRPGVESIGETPLEVSSDDRPVRPVHTPRMAPVSSGKSPQTAVGGATFVRAPPNLSLVQGSAKTCLNLGRFYV